MADGKLQYQNKEYYPRRVVFITVVPSYNQQAYAIGDAIVAKLVDLVSGIGPNCQVSKFQWIVATDEPSGAIWQDLTHEGVENVFVFSALVGTDWKFQCRPKCTDDEWEFDGLAAFLQRHIGQTGLAGPGIVPRRASLVHRESAEKATSGLEDSANCWRRWTGVVTVDGGAVYVGMVRRHRKRS